MHIHANKHVRAHRYVLSYIHAYVYKRTYVQRRASNVVHTQSRIGVGRIWFWHRWGGFGKHCADIQRIGTGIGLTKPRICSRSRVGATTHCVPRRVAQGSKDAAAHCNQQNESRDLSEGGHVARDSDCALPASSLVELRRFLMSLKDQREPADCRPDQSTGRPSKKNKSDQRRRRRICRPR